MWIITSSAAEGFRVEDVNDIFAELAACFVGALDGDGEIAHPDRLDYSVASLKVVDEYLIPNRDEPLRRAGRA